MMAVLEYMLILFVIPMMVSSKSFGGQSSYQRPNDTQACVNDLVAWCEGKKYPTEGGSISMVAVTIADQTGYCHVLCVEDSNGTNCTKNGSPWISCSKQNELTYKGNVLVKDSLAGTDNETCKAADNAFNDLFLNSSYDDSTISKEIEKGMEQFYKAMEESMAVMQRQLGGMFGGGFPFQNRSPDDVNTASTQNHREKE